MQGVIGDMEQFAECARREINGLFELPRKMTLIEEAAGVPDAADIQRGGGEKLFGLGDADLDEDFLERFPHLFTQAVNER